MNFRDLWPWGRKSASSLDIFKEIYGTKLSKAGVSVTWDTAIRVSTVLACARVIAQGIAQVPFKVYRDANDQKRPATGHPLYFPLHNQPNPWQTSFEYRETMGLHLALAGRHYAFKNVVDGVVRELIPFEPGKVEPKREGSGDITYRVSFDNGKVVDYPQEAIWHVRGMGWNGWQGMDAVDMAREAIGLSIAAESAHSRLFSNGVQSRGTYSVERTLNKEQYAQLRKHIVENTTGDNAGLPMIVDNGAKWLATSMTGEDAQHVELRRHQIEEVCRTMGVMPIMVGHADKTATYASAEQMFIAHVVHTLTPWYVRIEQSADAHLIGRKDVEAGYYTKFVAQGLLRGSMKDRADYFSKALGSGGAPAWLTQDEVRDLEERNPMGGEASKLPIATNVPKPAPQPEPQA